MNGAGPELNVEMPPAAQLMQLGMGFIVSQAISVAARLYIADHLKNGAQSIEALAALTETDAPSLYRLMRALSSVGIFRKEADGTFSNTVLSEHLREDHPDSMRSALHMICDQEHWRPHGNMLHSVKTGEIAFDYTFGMPVFPYFEQNPAAAEVFDNAMTSFSASISRAVAGTYDFSGAQTIADIGGGHGLVLSTVLKAFPHAKGILFDQPHVVSGANNLLENAGVAERVEIVSGDFFKEIPVEADIYLMKFILHDWNDEQCDAILANLAKSAQPGSKLLLIETVVEENDNQPSASKVMDLNMLVMTGGKERTPSEYAALLEKAGFKLTDVYPTPSPLQIVEAVRV